MELQRTDKAGVATQHALPAGFLHELEPRSSSGGCDALRPALSTAVVGATLENELRPAVHPTLSNDFSRQLTPICRVHKVLSAQAVPAKPIADAPWASPELARDLVDRQAFVDETDQITTIHSLHV